MLNLEEAVLTGNSAMSAIAWAYFVEGVNDVSRGELEFEVVREKVVEDDMKKADEKRD